MAHHLRDACSVPGTPDDNAVRVYALLATMGLVPAHIMVNKTDGSMKRASELCTTVTPFITRLEHQKDPAKVVQRLHAREGKRRIFNTCAISSSHRKELEAIAAQCATTAEFRRRILDLGWLDVRGIHLVEWTGKERSIQGIVFALCYYRSSAHSMSRALKILVGVVAAGVLAYGAYKTMSRPNLVKHVVAHTETPRSAVVLPARPKTRLRGSADAYAKAEAAARQAVAGLEGAKTKQEMVAAQELVDSTFRVLKDKHKQLTRTQQDDALAFVLAVGSYGAYHTASQLLSIDGELAKAIAQGLSQETFEALRHSLRVPDASYALTQYMKEKLPGIPLRVIEASEAHPELRMAFPSLRYFLSPLTPDAWKYVERIYTDLFVLGPKTLSMDMAKFTVDQALAARRDVSDFFHYELLSGKAFTSLGLVGPSVV